MLYVIPSLSGCSDYPKEINPILKMNTRSSSSHHAVCVLLFISVMTINAPQTYEMQLREKNSNESSSSSIFYFHSFVGLFPLWIDTLRGSSHWLVLFLKTIQENSNKIQKWRQDAHRVINAENVFTQNKETKTSNRKVGCTLHTFPKSPSSPCVTCVCWRNNFRTSTQKFDSS